MKLITCRKTRSPRSILATLLSVAALSGEIASVTAQTFYNPSLLDTEFFSWMSTDSWLSIWIVFSFIIGTVASMLTFQIKEWVLDILTILEVKDPILLADYWAINGGGPETGGDPMDGPGPGPGPGP